MSDPREGRSAARRRPTQQLIVQVRWADDLPDDLLGMDEALTEWLDAAHEVDNCDPMNYGLNLYVHTDDSPGAFQAVRALLDARGWTRLLRGAAYREFTPEDDDPSFVVIWPEGSREPFRYDHEE